MKRGRTTLIAIVLCVSCWSTTAFAQDDRSTHGLRNGRFWKQLDSLSRGLAVEIRTALIAGTFDGWKLRDQTEDVVTWEVIHAMSVGSTTKLSELAAMVDAAYSGPENLDLPVGWVLLACLAVQRGETTIEVVLAALRKHLTDLSTHRKEIPFSQVSPIKTIVSVSKLAPPTK